MFTVDANDQSLSKKYSAADYEHMKHMKSKYQLSEMQALFFQTSQNKNINLTTELRLVSTLLSFNDIACCVLTFPVGDRATESTNPHSLPLLLLLLKQKSALCVRHLLTSLTSRLTT